MVFDNGIGNHTKKIHGYSVHIWDLTSFRNGMGMSILLAWSLYKGRREGGDIALVIINSKALKTR